MEQFSGATAVYPPSPRPRLYRPAPREPADGSSLLFGIMFWFALAAAVELWWLNTPAGSLSSTADVLVAAGRITGLIGGLLLLTQILLMSRVGWLERCVDAHTLMARHRELGGFLLVVVLAHVVLTTLGYAAMSGLPVVQESWSMITTFEDMVSASIATGILVGVGVLAVRRIRRALPYEVWYHVHVTSYLVLVLGYGHQFADGQELMYAGFGRGYWAGLYFFVLGSLAWGRVLGPVSLNLRHRLRVLDVVPEGPDTISIYVTGRALHRMQVRAGQYFRWRFFARGCWWQTHPFSLSAAPNDRWLRLTVKVVGDHTRDLRYLKRGVRVFAEGPSGVFTAGRRLRPRALLIAGGSGIGPIRALLEELPRRAVVLYRATNEHELVFRDELAQLAADRDAEVWYVLGSRDDPSPRHLFSARGMRELVPDVANRDVYLCGPEGLVSAAQKLLRRLRVPRRQIHIDSFQF